MASDVQLQATSGNYTLSITLNQLNGQSPSPLDGTPPPEAEEASDVAASPLDGTTGYNFEHLIVLTDGSLPLS